MMILWVTAMVLGALLLLTGMGLCMSAWYIALEQREALARAELEDALEADLEAERDKWDEAIEAALAAEVQIDCADDALDRWQKQLEDDTRKYAERIRHEQTTTTADRQTRRRVVP